MTDNHHIIPLLVQLPPRLVRNRHVPQGLSTFEGEGWEDENLLVNLDGRRHLSRPRGGGRVRGQSVRRPTLKRGLGVRRFPWFPMSKRITLGSHRPSMDTPVWAEDGEISRAMRGPSLTRSQSGFTCVCVCVCVCLLYSVQLGGQRSPLSTTGHVWIS